MNIVVLFGRLVDAPKLSYTKAGQPVADMRLAVQRPGEDAGADFINVTAWNGTAKAAAEHLVRGQEITVQGRLQQETWTAEDGSQRSRLKVVAHQIHFGQRPRGGGGE